jgi:hypothetical protein
MAKHNCPRVVGIGVAAIITNELSHGREKQ